MNVDDAMETAAAYLAAHEQEQEPLFCSEEVAITLSAEVERLRAEIESVISFGPHPVEQVQMPLATFVKSRFVWRWQYNELVEALENVRSELAQLSKDWCDDDEAIKQQALRVLDAAKVEGDSVYVPRMGALAEMMADELLKVRAELAAAKAASVVPVELVALGDADWQCSVGVKTGADADKLYNWLRERMKDTTPPTT